MKSYSTTRPERPRLIITNSVGWPGNNATGPNRSLETIYCELGDEFDIHVFASHRSKGGTVDTLLKSTNDRVGKTRVTYLPPDRRGTEIIRQSLKKEPASLIWHQSFFAPMFTIAPLVMQRIGVVQEIPTILSPRGELSKEALAQKSFRKQSYLLAAKAFGLLGGVTLHATSDNELRDISRARLPLTEVVLAPDTAKLLDMPDRVLNKSSTLRLAFVGRISPIKGLDVALRALSKVRSFVKFDIFGPIQDDQYFHTCQSILNSLPANVEADYLGPLDDSAVVPKLANYDLFILPSKSENFGHAILEALSAGTPVLIGDQTPWHGLENAGAGWERPANSPSAFTACIETASSFGISERTKMSRMARAYAESRYSTADAISRTHSMLIDALGRPH